MSGSTVQFGRDRAGGRFVFGTRFAAMSRGACVPDVDILRSLASIGRVSGTAFFFTAPQRRKFTIEQTKNADKSLFA